MKDSSRPQLRLRCARLLTLTLFCASAMVVREAPDASAHADEALALDPAREILQEISAVDAEPMPVLEPIGDDALLVWRGRSLSLRRPNDRGELARLDQLELPEDIRGLSLDGRRMALRLGERGVALVEVTPDDRLELRRRYDLGALKGAGPEADADRYYGPLLLRGDLLYVHREEPGLMARSCIGHDLNVLRLPETGPAELLERRPPELALPVSIEESEGRMVSTHSCYLGFGRMGSWVRAYDIAAAPGRARPIPPPKDWPGLDGWAGFAPDISALSGGRLLVADHEPEAAPERERIGLKELTLTDRSLRMRRSLITPASVLAVLQDGDTAWATTARREDLPAQLLEIDLADPEGLRIVSSRRAPDGTYTLATLGDWLYMGTADGRIVPWNRKQKSREIEVGAPIPYASDFVVTEEGLSVSLAGHTTASATLNVLEHHDPSQLEPRSELTLYGHLRALALRDRRLAIAMGRSLRLYDLRDPTSPRLAWERRLDADWRDDVNALAWLNGRLLLLRGDSLHVWSLPPAGEPREMGQIEIGGTEIVLSRARALLRSADGDRVAVVDLSTPASPALLGELEIGDGPVSIAAQGDRVVTMAREEPGRIRLFDLARPPVLGRYPAARILDDPSPVSGWAHMALQDGHLIAARGDRLFVLDLDSPSGDEPRQSIRLPEAPRRILRLGSTLSLALGGAGLQRWSVADRPARPRWTTPCGTTSATALRIRGRAEDAREVALRGGVTSRVEPVAGGAFEARIVLEPGPSTYLARAASERAISRPSDALAIRSDPTLPFDPLGVTLAWPAAQGLRKERPLGATGCADPPRSAQDAPWTVGVPPGQPVTVTVPVRMPREGAGPAVAAVSVTLGTRSVALAAREPGLFEGVHPGWDAARVPDRASGPLVFGLELRDEDERSTNVPGRIRRARVYLPDLRAR